MTVRDFLKRITEEDMDKMMVWSDGHGWANITICKSECEITIKADYSMPFSDDVCYATGGIVDPAITYAPKKHYLGRMSQCG